MAAKKKSFGPNYDESEIRVAAALEGCDPRSVRKVLDGGTIRGVAAERVRRAIERLGSDMGSR